MSTTKTISLFLVAFAACVISFCGVVKEANVVTLADGDIGKSISKMPSGSNIVLAAKIYRLASPINIDGKENITINGNGATLIMNSLESDVIFISRSNNIVLKNFKATHIEPSGPTGCTGNVVHIEYGTNILVEKCELNGSGIVGIAAYYTENLKVLNNHIHKNSKYGIIYQGPSIEIKDNVFENNTEGHLYHSFVAKNGSAGWPPENLINKDKNKEGLVMSGNVFR